MSSRMIGFWVSNSKECGLVFLCKFVFCSEASWPHDFGTLATARPKLIFFGLLVGEKSTLG